MHYPLLALGLAGSALASNSIDYPVVNTTQGEYRGSPSPYREGVTAFKGIPFAASTAGERRWKAPIAAANHTGIVNATTFGDQCPQDLDAAGIFNTEAEGISEDCLNLNIWTPQFNSTADREAASLPVYFWTFGGRFEGGSGSVKTYDGTGLASKDVIVVTYNYRLAMLGFLATKELSEESGHNASGNYGLLDQHAALQWVYDNIESFGGNKSQIVAGGQSAGSASTLDLVYSPIQTVPLAGAISESGARGPHDPLIRSLAVSYRTLAAAEKQGKETLEDVFNVTTLAEARALSIDTIVTYGSSLAATTFDGTRYAVFDTVFMDPPLWRATIDGYVLPYTYGETLAKNAHQDIPIMTGNNKDESGASTTAEFTNVTAYTSGFSELFGDKFKEEFFDLYPASTVDEANEMFNKFWRDNSRVSTWNYAADWTAGGATSPVYVYYWNHTPAEDEESGAYHGSELWYTFNNIPYSDYSNVTWPSDTYEIERKMSDYWVNFIKSGNPNGDGLAEWPESTAADKEVMYLGNKFGKEVIATDAERKFILKWFASLPEY